MLHPSSIANQRPHTEKRVFLFLQGHPSPFARKVADELESRGHAALRINFCLGDRILWQGRGSHNFRKPFSHWESYLTGFVKEHGVTDILYYGDRKPYHQVAAEVARRLSIRTYAYEFGYLRPDWITLERGGMSAFSHFPNDPEKIRAIAAQFGEADEVERYPYTKPREITYEVSYNLISYFLAFTYPLYRADRYYNPLVEYISGIPGLFKEKRNHTIARRLTNTLVRQKHSYFVYSLQLQNDYQLRCNAPFKHQKEAIELTLQSFAKHSDVTSHLIIKAHPLDNGWEGWRRFVRQRVTALGLDDRVHFIAGGNLTMMLKRAKGCILINSTVGLHAIRAGCPVLALGSALFDIEGLTHRDGLDSFWTNPHKPDPDLTADLVKAIAGTIQVKGNFFTSKGHKAGVPAFADKLLEDMVNGCGAFEPVPPRLAALQAPEMPLYAKELQLGVGQASSDPVATKPFDLPV